MLTAGAELPGLIKTSWHRSQMPSGTTAGVLAHATMVLTAPPLRHASMAEYRVLAECGESARRRPATKSLHMIHGKQTGSVQRKDMNFSGQPPAAGQEPADVAASEATGTGCHRDCPEAGLTQPGPRL